MSIRDIERLERRCVKRAEKRGLLLARKGAASLTASLPGYELALKAIGDCGDCSQIDGALEALCSLDREDAWDKTHQDAWKKAKRLHGLTLSEAHELLEVE